jgi:alkylated DNA repair dioxygenase AlkB
MSSQLALFDAQPSLPAGFRYAPELLSTSEESELVARLGELPLKEFEFHGYRGKRRTASFGWHYDFAREALDRVDDMPLFLRALRERAAAFAGMAPERSAYLLSGASRSEWEHSIPPVESLRYSVTFRNLREK